MQAIAITDHFPLSTPKKVAIAGVRSFFKETRRRARSLFLSEIMTILVTFHQHHYRNFKHYYIDHVSVYWADAFPKLPSYQRFIEWIPQTLMPLCVYLKHCFGDCTGISFIDSTCLKACHNRHISGHRVFKHLAARGKTSVDWFFRFKLQTFNY